MVRSVQTAENGDHIYDLVECELHYVGVVFSFLEVHRCSLLLKFTVQCLKSQQIQLVEKTFVFSPVITNLSYSDAESVINYNS